MKMKKNILGVDIGGTKCAVIYGQKEGDTLHLVEKVKFPTTSVGRSSRGHWRPRGSFP